MRSFYQDRLGTNIGKTPKKGRFLAEWSLPDDWVADVLKEVREKRRKTGPSSFSSLNAVNCLTKHDHDLPRQARDNREGVETHRVLTVSIYLYTGRSQG
jgi:hypothetical protein